MPDDIEGTSGDDSLLGTAADESFVLFEGTDTLNGAGGFDLLRYDLPGVDGPIFVDLISNSVLGSWNGNAFSHDVSEIEHVRGTGFSDNMLGNADANLLEGGDGHDTIEGGFGNDTLIGGEGADVFRMGAGDGHDLISDFVIGIDTLDLSGLGVSQAVIDAAFASATDSAAGVVVDFGGGDLVTLEGLTKSDVGASNTLPIATVGNQTVFAGGWRQLSDLLTFSDADGDTLQSVEVWDSEGGQNWWANGAFVLANAGYETTDLNSLWFQADAAAGSQTLWVRGYDGTGWSAWDPFTLTTVMPLTVTVGNEVAGAGDWVRLVDVMDVSHAAGPLERVALSDPDGGDTWWVPGGFVDATGGFETTDIYNVWMRAEAAPGDQTLWVRGHDGSAWSAWDSFQFTTNTPPGVTVEDQVRVASAWTRLSDVMGFTDANGQVLAGLELSDPGGGATWWADGGFVDATSGYVVSDISNVWFQADATGSNQTLWVRGSDGADWSVWDAFTLTTNSAPEVVVPDTVVGVSDWVRLSDIWSYADADGHAIEALELSDPGGGDTWWADGGFVDASSNYSVTDMSNVWLRGDGAGSAQTLWARAHDGTEWSGWDSFVFTTNTAPGAVVDEAVAAVGQWLKLSDVLVFSDLDGHAMTRLELSDPNGGTTWWADGGFVAGAGNYEVNDLDNVWLRGEGAPGAQTLWLRGHDGTDWSAWDSFEFVTNTPPEVAVADQVISANGWWRLLDVLAFTDADGHTLERVELSDPTGGPSWWADGGFVDAQSEYYDTDDVENVWFQAGPVPGAQTLWVRGFDGTEWSTWDPFEVTAV